MFVLFNDAVNNTDCIALDGGMSSEQWIAKGLEGSVA